MRLRVWSVLSAFLASTTAQTISGLTFDGRDVVSLIWGMGDTVAASYDFWLCAGDESTGIYVSERAVSTWRYQYNQLTDMHYRKSSRESLKEVYMHRGTGFHSESIKT